MPDAVTPIPSFAAESSLERAAAGDSELLAGLAWGEPRPGHPEGTVGAHVAQLLEEIDRSGARGRRRAELRFMALVHDAFKYRVQGWRPKTGENHHAVRARRFAERFTTDERLLATIELHDRPYALWRKMRRKGRLNEARFGDMVARIPDPELFVAFIELDGSSEAKNPTPIRWLRSEFERRGILPQRGGQAA